MRQQHNISPPLPGRGSNRKRKREENDIGDTPASQPRGDQDPIYNGHEGSHYGESGQPHGNQAMQSDYPPDDADDLPPSLAALKDPQTGLILGRPESMVKYLIMKAKFEYIKSEHQLLLGEYEVLKRDEIALRRAKEVLLDDVLRASLGWVVFLHCPLPPLMPR